MPALKMLDLSKTAIERLPESVSNLECLIALLLSRCWKWIYVPSLRKLKRLISLDLSSTAITEAPVGLESLVNLRCLNLLYTDKLVMSASLISRLINLEYLQLDWAQCLTDATGQGIQGLENLEFIQAYFRDINVFNIYVSFPTYNLVNRSYYLTLQDANCVTSFEDIIPPNREYSMKGITFQHVAFGKRAEYSMKRTTLEGVDLGKRAVLPRYIKQLFIISCHHGRGARSLCNVLSYSHNNNLHQIELLVISNCEDVECLCCCSCPFCSSSQLVGCLYLYDLWNLKELVSPYADSFRQSTLFSHLTVLEIQDCNNMETLMTPKLLVHGQNLREIFVNSCEKMREMIGEDHSEMELAGGGCLIALLYNHLPHPTITLPRLTSLRLYSMQQLDFVHRHHALPFSPNILCRWLQATKSPSHGDLKWM